MNDSLVSVEWLMSHRHDPDLVLLDASLPKYPFGKMSQYPTLRIPGARPFDLKGQFADQNQSLPNMLPDAADFEREARSLGLSASHRIVVYDDMGIRVSPRVWWMLKVMGHEQVAVLDGGLPAWIAADGPTETRIAETYAAGNFVANFQPAAVRSAEELLANLSTSQEIVLDARSKGRFDGTAPEPRAGLKGGHIPQSLSLPFGELFENDRFLPPQELKQRFAALGIQDQPLVFSCGSGVTACVLYLAAEVAGMDNPKTIYDGSWSDWGRESEDFPVA